jgi:hypothetical protein
VTASLQRLSESSGPQNLLVNPTPGATISELAVDQDGRHSANAERLATSRNIYVLHVMDRNFIGWTRSTLHHLDVLTTCGIASTENFEISASPPFTLLLHRFAQSLHLGVSSKVKIANAA